MSARVISGSRGFPSMDLVDTYVGSLSEDTALILGRARGVDTRADEANQRRDRPLPVAGYRAQWDGRWGKLAGKVRNVEMIAVGDSLTAFWDGWSNGTAHAIAMAAHAGKLGRVFLPGDASFDEWAEHLGVGVS